MTSALNLGGEMRMYVYFDNDEKIIHVSLSRSGDY